MLPILKQKNSGTHIINIGSILGKIGVKDRTAYCASMFGVRGFTESLGQELRHFGIKVTSVNPGSINTNFFSESGVVPDENMLDPVEIAKLIVYILGTPDNMLIDEVSLRPLSSKKP